MACLRRLPCHASCFCSTTAHPPTALPSAQLRLTRSGPIVQHDSIPILLQSVAQWTSPIACLINFSKLSNWAQLPFSQRSSIVLWPSEASDGRWTGERRPRLSNRAEEEDYGMCAMRWVPGE
jgi:hypothetical protein